MKITWVSPHGDGWSMAHKLREAGNKVVYFCPEAGNKNGLGYLPRATEADWMTFAERSDLTIVDANFASRATRRSWEPSDYSLRLQQLRHKGVNVLGPTPTTELLENDSRYLRKVLKRAGLNYATSDGVAVTVSQDPEGRTYLVFRHRTLLGDGNGPELGNLGDIVIPVPGNVKLVRQVVEPLRGFLSRIGYHGHLNVAVRAGADIGVEAVHCRFIYPAVFAQFSTALSGVGGEQERAIVGLAVTLLRLDDSSSRVADQLTETPGFFGRDLQRELEGSAVANGPFLGAVVGLAPDWGTVQVKVNHQLSLINVPGWGWRTNVGDSIVAQLTLLKESGWLDVS